MKTDKPNLKLCSNHEKFKLRDRVLNMIVVRGSYKAIANYRPGAVYQLSNQKYAVSANRFGNASGVVRVRDE